MITLADLSDPQKRDQFDSRVANRVQQMRQHVPLNSGITSEAGFIDLLEEDGGPSKVDVKALVESLDKFD